MTPEERQAFKQRMKDIKAYREQNPGKGYWDWKEYDNGGTVGELVDAIYATNPKEEFLGEPAHHYDFTISEEEANRLGYFPDKRGHRDDRVKKESHPSHPSRGTWSGDYFSLTDKGMEDPNYTLFGLNDGGQDPQAILRYKDSYVLPEMTITPKDSYIYNSYDNIKLHLPKKYATGGKTEDDKVLWNWDSQLPEVIVLGKKKEYSDERTDHPIKKPKEYPIYRRDNGYITQGKSDDSWKKWDKDGDGTLSPKERWERQKSERRSEDWRNLGKGINRTFGTAAAAASTLYGGGWAATRSIKGNRASTLGGKLAKHVLSSNAVDTGFDAANMLFDPTDSSNILDLSTGLLLSRYKDFSKPVRQIGELINAGVNTYNTVDNYESGGETGDDDEERKQRFYEATGRNKYGVPIEQGLKPVFDLEDAANLTPAGDVLSAKDTYQAVKDRDWLGAGLAALGMVPIVPNIARYVKHGKLKPHAVPTVNPNKDQALIDAQLKMLQELAEKKAKISNEQYGVVERMMDDPAYLRRAEEVQKQFGDDYSMPYADAFISYNGDPASLPQVALSDDYRSFGNMERLSDGSFLYHRSRVIDQPYNAEHEVGHFVDMLKAGGGDADKGNNMFKEMSKDLKEGIDRHDRYFMMPTEQKSHMNQLREWMFQNNMIPTRDTKVDVNTLKKALKAVDEVSGMEGVVRASKQFGDMKLYRKWFNSIPLVDATTKVDEYAKQYV